MDVLLGNGSDEMIQLLALALNKPGATLLSVEPSFVMYRMIATFTGMRYVGVPLVADGRGFFAGSARDACGDQARSACVGIPVLSE